jgi:polyhydroxyalkanoate synthesis regulator phasin
MNQIYDHKKIKRSFRRFRDYSEDLLDSNSKTFSNNLNIFINFCENDEIMRIVSAQLKSNKNVNINRWYSDFQKTGGALIGSKEYVLPTNEEDRISLLYLLLLKIHSDEISFQRFCMDAYGKTNFNEMIGAFNDAISRPLIRDLGYRLDEIIETTNSDLEVPIGKLVIIQTGDRSINTIALGENIKQTVISQNSELDELVNKLCNEILNSGEIPEEEKEDLMIDVDTIKKQLAKKTPQKDRILPILRDLATFSTLASTAQKIITYVSMLLPTP